MKPLFRWVGGKRRMIPVLEKYIPKSFNTYVEPFAGAAALFFHLEPKGKAILSDANVDLMITYKMIKDNPSRLAAVLSGIPNNKEVYDRLRAEKPTDQFDMAVRFLYLNRLCVNGMWRVNKDGGMNTPYDHRRSGTSMNFRKEITEAARVLRLGECDPLTETVLISGNYKNAVRMANTGDFIFMDPPYVPFTANGHVDYTADGFNMEKHEELREEFGRLDKRGVHLILTNSDIPAVRELYKGYYMESVQTKATVGRTSGQGTYGELIITNQRIL